MVAAMRRTLLVCLFVLAACEPPPPEPAAPISKSRPPDRTEVTMQVTPVTPTEEAAKTETTEDTIGGKQPPDIEKAVAAIRPRIRACYNKGEPFAGMASFDVIVGKDGKVANARFVKHEGVSEDTLNCLIAAVRTMTTLDPEKKSQIVTFTFDGKK